MFEYMTITLTAFEAELPNPVKLNEAGRDGWEMVSAVTRHYDSCVVCFMKRPMR